MATIDTAGHISGAHSDGPSAPASTGWSSGAMLGSSVLPAASPAPAPAV